MKKPDYLFGINPVTAALSSSKRNPLRLYLNISEKERKGERTKRIFDLAESKGVKTKYLIKSKLEKFCGGRAHQNVILKCSQLEPEGISK